MKDPNRSEWCAHVTFVDSKEVKEIIFDSARGSKYAATGDLLRHLGLTSVNDPSIKSIKLQESSVPNRKPHYIAGKPEEVKSNVVDITTAAPKKPPKFDHKYLVRLYVTPHVSTPRQFRMFTADPNSALIHAAFMAGVKDVSSLGPYCVEEIHEFYNPNTKVTRIAYTTRMIKGAASFPGAGPVLTSGIFNQAPAIAARPTVAAPSSKVEEYVSDVIDILSKETKETRKKYNIKQD